MDRHYPELPAALRVALESIEPTNGFYYPCLVSLKGGAKVDRVYLAEAGRWYLHWGIWPDEDRGKHAIDLADVDSLSESPSRLPARFADLLYRAGESGMGYTIFTVRFVDGSSAAFGTGNAIDFLDYPPGQSAGTVAEVLPHVGRDDPRLRTAPSYYWCLFDGSTQGIDR